MKRLMFIIVIIIVIINVGVNLLFTVKFTIPAHRYPETTQHMQKAIAAGKTTICTIDRKGAKARRQQALENVPVKRGYDRDEYPPAMCREGGKGADVKYIDPSDNRGAGAYMGYHLKEYPNGTRIKFEQ